MMDARFAKSGFSSLSLFPPILCRAFIFTTFLFRFVFITTPRPSSRSFGTGYFWGESRVGTGQRDLLLVFDIHHSGFDLFRERERDDISFLFFFPLGGISGDIGFGFGASRFS